MKRALARGRVFPQSYSTDRRIGRLSLKAWSLFPLIWVNGDDQGRLSGDPEEVKYTCCPNIDHITKTDIPELLTELEQNKLIKIYDTPKSTAIQILDWWDIHKPQWAWPSEYLPPEGWEDHLRYKRGAKEVVTINWFSQVSTQVSDPTVSGESSGEKAESAPFLTPIRKKKEERGKRKEERGSSPEDSPEERPLPSISGESPPPALTVLPTKLLNRLIECYRVQWGRVPAGSLDEVIPREPDAKNLAQLRDLADELSRGGGCPLDYINQAFREAAGQQKFHVRYVRRILLNWLGIEKTRSP